MQDEGLAVQPVVPNDKFSKYNIEMEIPTYTDEEYDAYLRSDDWSREETDYLMEMVKDFSYRWAVVWDRYDYQPSAPAAAPDEDSKALATMPFAPPKARTVEDLKARFYDISAKLMKLHIPEVQMDGTQYQLYETLTKYNPQLEANRKELAASLMCRSIDEVREEEFLLTELQRINMSANRLEAERNELRSTLEAPIPLPNPTTPAVMQSFPLGSHALHQLLTTFQAQDRNKKRQGSAAVAAAGSGAGGRLGPANDASGAGTPTAAQQAALTNSRRQSMAQTPHAPPQTPLRQLTPHQEYRFNVSNHDRLTSGVSFGSDKLLKMRQAKSNVQTQKIATALAELGVPEIIPIPTSRVGEVFEKLIGSVSRLLDVRKVREKEEGECRVLEGMKKARGLGDGTEGEAKGDAASGAGGANGTNGTTGVKADGDTSGTAADASRADQTPKVKTENDDGTNAAQDADADGEADEATPANADADAEGEDDSRQPSVSASASVRGAGGHKRSASVMSQESTKDAKRPRK